ncbi:conserved hypothetical protein [Aspergillus lentulus]|nr:conserved hypothetical protein [Aspergillus lentulus]
MDGASNLRPRLGVVGSSPLRDCDRHHQREFPGGGVTGFILETDSFNIHESGKLNTMCFSGDNSKVIGNRWYVRAALLSLGNATFDLLVSVMRIMMGGKQAV